METTVHSVDDPTVAATPIPAWMRTPPTIESNPPVSTRRQQLPFDELSWKNFERLCVRLAENEAHVEHCQLYGVSGQDQEGIDLYARESLNPKYRVYQCKNEAGFSASKIRRAVEVFLKGSWPQRSDTFILCTRESLEATDRAEEFERQVELLRGHGIALLPWDSSQLARKLKGMPVLVDDFFGRAWVREFCGSEAADNLRQRFDAEQMTAFRRQMGRFYSHVFAVQDPGLLIKDARSAILPLKERFVVPDVRDQRELRVPAAGPSEIDREERSGGIPGGEGPNVADESRSTRGVREATTSIEGRRRVDEWLAANRCSVILGGPGSGKSTLLRILAIDLLCEEPTFASLSRNWATYLPVWVPFPVWTKLIADHDESTSLTEMLHQWLKGWSEERLWPLIEKALTDGRLLLLVDGLDEWTNERAAAIAINRLRVFVNQRDTPAVLASRPHGFGRLGMGHGGWEVAELADFTPGQQKRLAQIWHLCRLRSLHDNALTTDEIDRRAEAASDEFIEELARSTDFQELAKVPLLLCLLIVRRMHDGYLPTSRFKAYEQLVELLSVHHPTRRRIAANITDEGSNEITDEDTKQILAFLAYEIQTSAPAGLIEKSSAEELVRAYLKDSVYGFGFSDREAKNHASRLLDITVETIGILVSRSQTEVGFFHRTAQEYLAACHLVSLSLAEQLEVVRERCCDSRWREVLLNLFFLTRRAEDLQTFIDAMRSEAAHPADRVLIDQLSTEVACGVFNCPVQLAKEIVEGTFTQIEMGSWLPIREKLLRSIVDGLRSVKLRGLIQDRLLTWFPSRLNRRESIFDAMVQWPREAEVVACLLRGLQDEECGVQRAVSRSLASHAASDDSVGDRVAELAQYCDVPLARAAALDALSVGWPRHGRIANALEAARRSMCLELRLAAIMGRVRRGEHTDEDRQELVRLGSWHWNLDSHWQPEIGNALVQGWSRSDELKEICFTSFAQFNGNQDYLDHTTATIVLLQAFPGDNEVARYFARHIRESEHPFLLIDQRRPWELLAKSFPGHQDLAEAVDVWFGRPQHYEPTIAAAALVGRTELAKRTLLRLLETTSVPFWASKALLEGWGMNDPEVAAPLRAMATGEAKKACLIACDLPAIMPNLEECRLRLLGFLKDPTCPRPDLVLDGLETLGTAADVEVLETILTFLSERTRCRTDRLHGLHARIIRLYSWDRRVREMAKEELEDPDGYHATVAKAFGADDEIRHSIIRHATPLPSVLRDFIARNLKPAVGSLDFVLSTFDSYHVDSSEPVKVHASIAYHSALRTAGRPRQEAVEKLRREITYGGDPYWPRRQAAFVGLVLLDRMDVYEESRDWLRAEPRLCPTVHDLQANPAFVRFLLQHWDVVNAHRQTINLGVERWLDFWEFACVQADEFPAARQEALRMFETTEPTYRSADVLRFLARTRPKSRFLLDCCLKALQVGEAQKTIDLGWETVAAAEILATQFTNDRAVHSQLLAECDDRRLPYHAALALCEGWPDDPILDRYREHADLDSVRNLFTGAVVIRFISVKGTSEEVWRMLDRLLTIRRPQNFAEVAYSPVVRRLRSDDRLCDFVWEALKVNPSANRKATLPKLLHTARGMTDELKTWCRTEIERQVGPEPLSEIGFDLASAFFRPVWHSLMDIAV